MKRQDFLFLLLISSIIFPFVFISNLFDKFMLVSKEHAVITGFIKFMIIATIGEMIAYRIKTGNYISKTFGLFPRAIIWGLLGVSIVFAFKIFSSGTPMLIEYLGFANSIKSMEAKDIFDASQQGLALERIITAFGISFFLNIFYAPLLMVSHKITDTHIEMNKGSAKALWTNIKIVHILKNINWSILWGFVIKRMIPLFWIPAQTITFLMPSQFRILFAAFLGLVLGLILALANIKTKQSS